MRVMLIGFEKDSQMLKRLVSMVHYACPQVRVEVVSGAASDPRYSICMEGHGEIAHANRLLEILDREMMNSGPFMSYGRELTLMSRFTPPVGTKGLA